jgi:hypothetical protein
MFTAAGSVLLPEAPASITGYLALLGLVANALPITPGGLGVGEAAFEGLFRTVGYAGGAQMILAWRAGMLALCCVGCVFYIAGNRKQRHPLSEAGIASHSGIASQPLAMGSIRLDTAGEAEKG